MIQKGFIYCVTCLGGGETVLRENLDIKIIVEKYFNIRRMEYLLKNGIL